MASVCKSMTRLGQPAKSLYALSLMRLALLLQVSPWWCDSLRYEEQYERTVRFDNIFDDIFVLTVRRTSHDDVQVSILRLT
jgi:hypothetical protein